MGPRERAGAQDSRRGPRPLCHIGAPPKVNTRETAVAVRCDVCLILQRRAGLLARSAGLWVLLVQFQR